MLWMLHFSAVGKTSCLNPGTGQLHFPSHSLLWFYARTESLIFPEKPCQDGAANRRRCLSKLPASLLTPWPEPFQVPKSLHAHWQQWLPPFHTNDSSVLDSLCKSGLCRACHFHLFWQNTQHPGTQPCLFSFIGFPMTHLLYWFISAKILKSSIKH